MSEGVTAMKIPQNLIHPNISLALQHEMEHPMIDRIQQSPHERLQTFLAEAKACKDDADKAQVLCEAEMEWLYAHYARTTVHKKVTEYHHALGQAGLLEVFETHIHEDPEIAIQRRKDRAHSESIRHRHQYPIINVDRLIEKATSLLMSSNYSHVLVGLELLTGRRTAELGVTAEFMYTQEREVWFKGQLKTRESENARLAYAIPVLIPATHVCQGLNHLRLLRSFVGYTPEQFNATAGSTVRKARKALFESLLPKGALSVYEPLRKVYAAIAYDWFAPPNWSDNAYFAEILGHNIDDVHTSISYKDFYLATLVTDK